MVICTDGGKGTTDTEMTPQRLRAIREEEQRNAAAVLGIKEVAFLGYPDGELEDSREVRRDVVREIRRFRPDIVLTPDPYRTTHSHRDHRICGQVTMDAVFPYARDYHHFPELAKEGFLPHKTAEVYGVMSDHVDHYVDISDTIDVKIEALKAHVSQVRDREGMAERVKERAAELGKKAGYAYAEGFHRFRFQR